MNPEQSYNQFVNSFVKTQLVWILNDEHGAMMMVADNEDCIPVWNTESEAINWAKDDWEDCKPLSISIADFRDKWIPGMEEDELMLVIFPEGDTSDENGIIITPFELEQSLASKA